MVTLRGVLPEDLPTFFVNQLDPQAQQLAAVPSRDSDAFDAHWQRVLGEPSAIVRTILLDGEVAGNIMCFGEPDQREVGYWVGRRHWGRGVATQALSLLLAEVRERPLHAHVAAHHAGSIRVLEKCAFKPVGEPAVAEDGVTELSFELA